MEATSNTSHSHYNSRSARQYAPLGLSDEAARLLGIAVFEARASPVSGWDNAVPRGNLAGGLARPFGMPAFSRFGGMSDEYAKKAESIKRIKALFAVDEWMFVPRGNPKPDTAPYPQMPSK